MAAETKEEPEGAFEDLYPRTPRKSVLGHGAFGIVFAVTARGNPSKRFVAKEIHVESLSQQKRREALAESALLRTLAHPNVVACIDTVLRGSSLYIVMEYATGGDLCRHIRKKRDADETFSERAVMTAFVQVLCALKFVHERKILHRDIKPANIFVFGTGDLGSCKVKLGDFGLGRMFDATTFEALSLVGSPSYFPPEVCKSKPYGRKADMWSLGVVLYELCCLEVPFAAKTILAVALRICRDEAKPLPAEYSAEVGDVVGRLLQKEAPSRPAAAALLQEPFVRRHYRHCGRSSSKAPPDGAAPAAASPPPPAAPPPPNGGEEPAGEQPGGPGSTEEPARCRSPGAGAAAVDVPIVDASWGSSAARSDELPCSPSSPQRAELIKDCFSRHCAADAGGQGTLSGEALAQLLLLAVPGLTGVTASQVISAAGCRQGEAVDFAAFVEWLAG